MTPQIKQRIEQIRSGEVPEGYKRTRAGIIPSDWFLHPLTQHLFDSASNRKSNYRYQRRGSKKAYCETMEQGSFRKKRGS